MQEEWSLSMKVLGVCMLGNCTYVSISLLIDVMRLAQNSAPNMLLYMRTLLYHVFLFALHL